MVEDFCKRNRNKRCLHNIETIPVEPYLEKMYRVYVFKADYFKNSNNLKSVAKQFFDGLNSKYVVEDGYIKVYNTLEDLEEDNFVTEYKHIIEVFEDD